MDQNYKLLSEVAFDKAVHELFRQLNEDIDYHLTEFHKDIVFSVHEIRKLIKRIRALVKLVKPCLVCRNFELLNKQYRDLGRVLSEVRDAHIRAQIFYDLSSNSYTKSPTKDFLILYNLQSNSIQDFNFDKENPESVYNVFCKHFRSIENSNLAKLITGQRKVTMDCTLKGFNQAYRKGYDYYLRVINDSASPAEFHEFRKEVKNTLYMSEFLSNKIDFFFSEFTVAKLNRLSDLLGRHHDHHIVIEWVRQIDKSNFQTNNQSLLHYISDLNESIEKDIVNEAGKLYSVSPKTFSQAVLGATTI